MTDACFTRVVNIAIKNKVSSTGTPTARWIGDSFKDEAIQDGDNMGN